MLCGALLWEKPTCLPHVSCYLINVLSQLTQVTAEHAQAAYDESFDSVHMFQLLKAPPLAKVLLAAILQERRATGAPPQGGRLAPNPACCRWCSLQTRVGRVGAPQPSSSGRCCC